MGAVEELMTAVEGAGGLDSETKGVVIGFLEEGGPALGVLAPELLQEVMRQVAGNRRAAAIEAIAGSLSAGQVAALLETVRLEVEQMADSKAASVAAGTALIEALERAALAAIVQAIIAAL
jgi:hypothetical protein